MKRLSRSQALLGMREISQHWLKSNKESQFQRFVVDNKYRYLVVSQHSFFVINLRSVSRQEATMTKIIFKVHLMIVEGDFEIRKFYMDADVALNFISLREKLRTIFPILEVTKYRLLWQGNYFSYLSLIWRHKRDFLMSTVYIMFTNHFEIIICII